MKTPNTVNLQTSAEIRKAGWQAECRDADGHLCRTHVPFETDEEIVWLVREAMEHGETITIWPSSEVAETPPPSSHAMGGDLMESGQAFANQVRAIVHKLDGQAYSSTVSALNLFDAELRRARATLATATEGSGE